MATILQYGLQRQGSDRKDVLYICRSMADDLCEKHGCYAALNIAAARYTSVVETWQKANWRMIIRYINEHVRINNLRTAFGDL